MSEKKKISDNLLRKLWTDPEFPGSFQSAVIFAKDLEFEKGIKVSLRRIYKALSQIKDFQKSVRSIKKFDRRSYFPNVRGFWNLIEADLAIMPYYNRNRYILVVIDVFSRRIYTRILTSKKPFKVIGGIQSIFDEVGIKPSIFQADRGLEFTSKETQEFFEKNNIRFNEKIGPYKAAMAEWAVGKIKKVLYTQMRYEKTNNWPSLLQAVVLRINKTPMKKLNWKRPIDFASNWDDKNIPLPEPVNLKELLKNQKQYEKKKTSLKIGDKVLLDEYIFRKHTNFPKGYHLQVSKTVQKATNLPVAATLFL